MNYTIKTRYQLFICEMVTLFLLAADLVCIFLLKEQAWLVLVGGLTMATAASALFAVTRAELTLMLFVVGISCNLSLWMKALDLLTITGPEQAIPLVLLVIAWLAILRHHVIVSRHNDRMQTSTN